MVKIIMHGCNGHMGQVITGLVKEDANAEIIAGIDMNDNGQNDYPVFKSLAECDVPADVVVDFSSYKAADALLDACKEKKLPLVLCTSPTFPVLTEEIYHPGYCSKQNQTCYYNCQCNLENPVAGRSISTIEIAVTCSIFSSRKA